MDTLQNRLADLADDAPTGGVPAAELWARGKRAHRLRAAAAGATVLVVGAVGTGIGASLVDGRDNAAPAPAAPVNISLPIDYPVGEELPDLGDAPGKLAAIWLVPPPGSASRGWKRGVGEAPEVVGLVAETGRFGTLPIEVSTYFNNPDRYFALSPDGRRIAYDTPSGELVARDLVSGASYTLAFEDGFQPWEPNVNGEPGAGAADDNGTWVDATHLVGHRWDEGAKWISEADGWVWQPGTVPKRQDLMRYPGSPYLGPHAGVYDHPWFSVLPAEGNPRRCLSTPEDGGGPLLCDVVGVIGPEIALTHDGDGAVVALDAEGVDDPAMRHVVATAGAPIHVTFATDLIAHALDLAGGAS